MKGEHFKILRYLNITLITELNAVWVPTFAFVFNYRQAQRQLSICVEASQVSPSIEIQ